MYTVVLNGGLVDVVLPNGNKYQGGNTVILSDAEYGVIPSATATLMFASATYSGGGGVASAATFSVLKYGAKGDGQVVGDGAMTAGSPNVACATSTPFGTAKVGMSVMVKGSGITGVTSMRGLITAITDSGHIVLDTNASVSVAGALVFWGTDDTPAFIAAVDAAISYGAQHGAGIVSVPVAPVGDFYVIDGVLQTGGATAGCAQIPLGAPIPTTSDHVTLCLEGEVNASTTEHWQQTVPALSGSTLVSFQVNASVSAQANLINASGNPSVLGGPTQPYGYGKSVSGNAVFSNMLVEIRDVSILTAHSAEGLTYTAIDLSGVACANLENVAYGTTGTVPGGDFTSPAGFANGAAIGLLMPANGNNDDCNIVNLTCHGGYTWALFATEHTVIPAARLLYSWSAYCPVGVYFGSVGATHAMWAGQLSIEGCVQEVCVIGPGSSGIGPRIDIDQLDTEHSNPTIADNDSGAALATAVGSITFTGLFGVAGVNSTYPTGLKITNGQSSDYKRDATGSTTASLVDRRIFVDASGGVASVQLPALSASVDSPLEYVVVKKDSSANAVNLVAASGQVIQPGNAQTKAVGTTQWSTVKVVAHGGFWVVAA